MCTSNQYCQCWLEKNSGGKHNWPSLIAIKSDKDPELNFWMSDKPLECQHLNEKNLKCSGLLISSYLETFKCRCQNTP